MKAGRIMALLEHLHELRRRLIRIACAIGIATIVGLFFTPQLLKVLLIPSASMPSRLNGRR